MADIKYAKPIYALHTNHGTRGEELIISPQTPDIIFLAIKKISVTIPNYCVGVYLCIFFLLQGKYPINIRYLCSYLFNTMLDLYFNKDIRNPNIALVEVMDE